MALGRAIPHNIKIEASDNQGFTMIIGCGRFVYSLRENLMVGLERYLEDPEKLEKEYLEAGRSVVEVATDIPEPPRPSHQEGG